MIKVLFTGGSGLVGSRLVELLSLEFSFLTPSSQELDITNKQAIQSYFSTHEFDLVLHLAAYTNVDRAETEQELCHKINVEGTRNLFEAAKALNKSFIFISTDFVFSGNEPEYNENSIPNPTGYYGQSKAEAEAVVKGQAMIVRISYPYRAQYPKKNDFVKTIRVILKEGRTVMAISDSLFTPTFVDDIAQGLKLLIKNFKREIYHLVGRETFSPFEAFKQIAEVCGYPGNLITPISYAEYFKNRAPRPQYSKIINTKLDLRQHSFREGLQLVKAANDC